MQVCLRGNVPAMCLQGNVQVQHRYCEVRVLEVRVLDASVPEHSGGSKVGHSAWCQLLFDASILIISCSGLLQVCSYFLSGANLTKGVFWSATLSGALSGVSLQQPAFSRADKRVMQMAAGKTPTINRPGLLQLIRAFTKEETREAIWGLRGMTGLTARQLPGTKPVLFFATLPESFEDGFQALQEYVEGKVSVHHLSVG